MGVATAVAVVSALLWAQQGTGGSVPSLPPVGGDPVYRAIEIRVEPENAFTAVPAETYLYHLRTRAKSADGRSWRSYDERELLQDFDRLWATGFLDDLRIEVSDSPFPNGAAGRHVTFVLTERDRVKFVSFQGTGRLTTADIDARLQERDLVIHPDTFLDASRLRSIAGVVRTLYNEHGYRQANVAVETTPVEGSPRTVAVVFRVTEGPRTRVLETTFPGHGEVSEAALRGTLKHTKGPGLFTFMTGGSVFSNEAFDEDAALVQEYLRDRGYVAAIVGQPQLTVVEESLAGDVQWVRVEVPIETGPRYRVGTVTFAGNEKVDSAVLAHVFRKIEPGEFYRHQDFEDARTKLQELYGATGYLDFSAYPDLQPVVEADVPTVNVTITVTEGEQYVVNRIDVSGNTTTRDDVIRREIMLVEGGTFNTEALRVSLRRLNQLGFFKPIEDGESVAITPVPGNERSVDIRLKVEEENRNQISFGLGVSQVDGFFGNVGFQTSNFLGRGETVSLSLQRGQTASNYQIAATRSYIAGRPIGAGVTAFSTKLDYQDGTGTVYYSEVRQGGSLSLSMSRGFLRYGLQLARESINTQLLNSFTSATGLRDGRYEEARLSPSMTYNTVDHPVFPRRGLRLSGSVDLAGGWLGGTLRYIRPEGEAQGYLPLGRRFAIGGRVTSGALRPYGETDALPYYRRYFLGGETSIRGLEVRTVGPYNDNNQPAGGDKFVLFNAELSVDLLPMARLLAFHDAGQAFAERERIDLRHLRTSTGLELRVMMPVINAPIRLIYSWNIYRDSFQPAHGFRFAIGSTF